MRLQEIQEFCEKKPNVEATFPFDEDTLAYKVAGKIFVLIPLQKWESGNHFINLKCDPDYAIQLRNQYDAIKPGYHSSKKHWNSLYLKDQQIPSELLCTLITHSYDLVVKGLSKKLKAELEI